MYFLRNNSVKLFFIPFLFLVCVCITILYELEMLQVLDVPHFRAQHFQVGSHHESQDSHAVNNNEGTVSICTGDSESDTAKIPPISVSRCERILIGNSPPTVSYLADLHINSV